MHAMMAGRRVESSQNPNKPVIHSFI